MSWTLQASGHTADADKERKLAEDFGLILAACGDDVTAAHFAGTHVSGEPRHIAAETAGKKGKKAF